MHPLRQSRWLVTGAKGQLGTAIVRAAGQGAICIPLDRRNLDVTDAAAVSRVVADIAPDVIFNCAAYTNVDSAELHPKRAAEANWEGARNLARAAANLSESILVQVSTDYVFGATNRIGSPWSEQDIPNPMNEYGRSKAMAEREVLETLPGRSAVIRTAWLYEAGYSNFVSLMIRGALRGVSSRVVNDQWGQPTWARDAASMMIRLVSGLRSGEINAGTYHATNAGETTWFDLAQYIYASVGSSVDLVEPIASSDLNRPALRPSWSVLSHDAWTEIGLPRPRPWQDALADALPWFLGPCHSEP